MRWLARQFLEFQTKDDSIMVRPNYRDAITQAVYDINRNPALSELNVTAIKQAVVLRVLDAAGWSAFDLLEVEPDFQVGSAKVDFALKSASSLRQRAAATPKVLVEVKSLSENLDSERHQRRLMTQCGRAEVELGVLTNGLRWLFCLWSPEGGRQEDCFCDVNIMEDPEAAATELNNYLAKDKVTNGQAVRSAERSLRERNRDELVRSSIVEGWQQVVRGLDEGLVELIATAAERKTGIRPENRLVRRVLIENRADLLASAVESDASTGSGSGRSRPSSFTFQSERHDVRSWPELLVEVCSIMRERHPDDFENILQIGGRKNRYFSRNADELVQPRQVGDTGIYASCQGAGALITGRAGRVLELFGYPEGSLTVQTR